MEDEEIDLFADDQIRERVPIVRVTDRRMSPQSNHELEELKVRMVMRIESCSREVTKDTDRDHFMSASEAKTWGIVDKVL